MRYVKKPIPVEARYLTDGNAASIVEWIKAEGGDAIIRGGPKGGSQGASVGIKTLEGRIWYEPGWVIIQGVQDEFYGCRRDVFEQTYEPEPESSPAPFTRYSGTAGGKVDAALGDPSVDGDGRLHAIWQRQEP